MRLAVKLVLLIILCLYCTPSHAQINYHGTVSGNVTVGAATIAASEDTFVTNAVVVCHVVGNRSPSGTNGGSLWTVSGVADTGGANSPHTWTRRAAKSDAHVVLASYLDVEEWYSVWPAINSGVTITATFSGTGSGGLDGGSMLCTEYQGVNPTNPWDPNASLPALGTPVAAASAPTTPSFSTTDASGALLNFVGMASPSFACTSNAQTAGAGYTLGLSRGTFAGVDWACVAAQYQIVSATQSSVTGAFGLATWPDTITIADALCAANNASCAGAATSTVPGVGAVPYPTIWWNGFL